MPTPSGSLQPSAPIRHLTALRLRRCALDGNGLKLIALALGGLGQYEADAEVHTPMGSESRTSDSGSSTSTALQMLGCLDLAYNPQLFAVAIAGPAFSGDSGSETDGFASESSDGDGARGTATEHQGQPAADGVTQERPKRKRKSRAKAARAASPAKAWGESKDGAESDVCDMTD